MRASWELGALLLAAALSSVACGGSAPEPASELVVFAAASLAEALPEAVTVCTETQPIFSFGGSNVLARQIESTGGGSGGADLFVSADERWMDQLEETGRIVPTSRRDLLSNQLVVIAHRDRAEKVEGPAGLASHLAQQPDRLLVLADPEAVPAGRYAREFLERAGVWGALQPRIVPALDVRAALHLVEALPDAIGIVYRTDLEASDAVQVLFPVPREQAPEIRYTVAVVANSAHPEKAKALLGCLGQPEAGAVFARHGFLPYAAD